MVSKCIKTGCTFFPLDDGIYCQRFGAVARDERRRLVARGGGASALDAFNGQRIMPIYVCTVIKKMKGWSVQRPGVEDDTESFRG